MKIELPDFSHITSGEHVRRDFLIGSGIVFAGLALAASKHYGVYAQLVQYLKSQPSPAKQMIEKYLKSLVRSPFFDGVFYDEDGVLTREQAPINIDAILNDANLLGRNVDRYLNGPQFNCLSKEQKYAKRKELLTYRKGELVVYLETLSREIETRIDESYSLIIHPPDSFGKHQLSTLYFLKNVVSILRNKHFIKGLGKHERKHAINWFYGTIPSGKDLIIDASVYPKLPVKIADFCDEVDASIYPLAEIKEESHSAYEMLVNEFREYLNRNLTPLLLANYKPEQMAYVNGAVDRILLEVPELRQPLEARVNDLLRMKSSKKSC